MGRGKRECVERGSRDGRGIKTKKRKIEEFRRMKVDENSGREEEDKIAKKGDGKREEAEEQERERGSVTISKQK